MSSEDTSEERKISEEWNGLACVGKWQKPERVAESDAPCRSDQKNMIPCHEYLDDDKVLDEKVDMLVDMIKKSKHVVLYSGAGLSRGAGIADYASKADNSVSAVGAPKLKSPLDAEPTISHNVIAHMFKHGYIHEVVNQNHDGLAAKAGVPEWAVNEIHGAWFDPSNPVVQFNQSLRGDLFERLLQSEEKADLCLCVGTSLSGMNADRVVSSTAKRYVRKGQGQGSVIINLQATPLDSVASLRVWHKADDVFARLAQRLGLPLEKIERGEPCHTALVPYDEQGHKRGDGDQRLMVLDCTEGQRVVVGQPHDTQMRYRQGTVEKISRGNPYLSLDGIPGKNGQPGKLGRRSAFGHWWIREAALGTVSVLPVRNVAPRFLGPADTLCVLRYSCVALSDKRNYEWTIAIANNVPCVIRQVSFKLHPTFEPSLVTLNEPPFVLKRSGWGTFQIPISILYEDGGCVDTVFHLDFTLHDKEVPILVKERKVVNL